MEFKYRYVGKSQVSTQSSSTDLSFAPDSLRPPTYFVGKLKQHLAFREAISALHNVVISDMRYKPKDRSDYLEWLANEEERLLLEFTARKNDLQEKVSGIQQQLQQIAHEEHKVMKPFYKAQKSYFHYLWQKDRDAWYVLDPVITVHPDEVFFECFSEDESSYGKLSCQFNVFDHISDKAYGTTNIDYSEGLYQEFQKIRTYRETSLKIDPDGFQVQSGTDDVFEEKKIDLPDSWVRGFLQVSSAMTMPMVALNLHPMDVHNLCYCLRRRKERVGPRALRFELTPERPVKIVLEPWDQVITCARSLYQGETSRKIRVWGRRRLHILERLIPMAKSFKVYLLGNGMPSFYVADLGEMSFTLGLSGWSANDWSRMGNFDLLAPRGEVDEITLMRVYQALCETWQESCESLAKRLKLDETVVKSALAACSQQGQVLYDLASKVYRIRELCREPLPLSSLRFSNEREEKASLFVNAQLVKLTHQSTVDKGVSIQGEVLDDGNTYLTRILIDHDDRLQDAQCQCFFYRRQKLSKGPCEHMLALRLYHNRRGC